MGTSIVHYQVNHDLSTMWGVLKDDGLHPIAHSFPHQADLMHAYFTDRAIFEQLVAAQPLDTAVTYLSPLLSSTQLFCPRS